MGCESLRSSHIPVDLVGGLYESQIITHTSGCSEWDVSLRSSHTPLDLVSGSFTSYQEPDMAATSLTSLDCFGCEVKDMDKSARQGIWCC